MIDVLILVAMFVGGGVVLSEVCKDTEYEEGEDRPATAWWGIPAGVASVMFMSLLSIVFIITGMAYFLHGTWGG